MLKDHVRDYVTEAFRVYAAFGELSGRELRRKIVGEDRAALELCRPLLCDAAAVRKTLDLLALAGRDDIISAIRHVYFAEPSRLPSRGSFSARVVSFSMNFPASERNVYLWLREGRVLCAYLRGLSVSRSDFERYVRKYL